MKALPKVSSIEFLKHSAQILKNPLPFHEKNFKKLGDTFQLELGFGKYVVFSKSHELALEALQKNQKNFKKSKIQTEDLVKYVGKGLLTAEDEDWKTQRQLLQPTFYKKNIEGLLEIMESTIKDEVDKIKPNTEVDAFPIFNDLAFKVVARALFSDAITSTEITRLQHITEETQQMLVRELRQPYKKWWFRLSGILKEKLKLTAEAKSIITTIIQKRRQSEEQPDDLLNLLMHSTYEDGSFMTEEKLLDEILILFIAGHETTSNALCFTTQLLAQNPAKEQKLEQQVAEHSNNTNLIDRLKHNTYANLVIEESMRLFPPVYFIDRVNKSEVIHDNYIIPEETDLLFSIYEIHRNPKLWNNPKAFIPERFEDAKRYSKHYFPFGAGPRKCIGNMFAMYEMNLVLQELTKKFKIEATKPDIEILPLISLKPKNAIIKLSLKN